MQSRFSKFSVLKWWSLGVTAALAAAIGAGAHGQERPGIEPDRAAMYQHMRNAREIAGADLYAHYVHRCIIDQIYRRTLSRGIQASGVIPATRVFDQLYFVGENAVSSWLLDTGDGYVLFDAQVSPEALQNTVESGMRELGLDPADIRFLVITHAHGDHFGGARYLAETYGTRIIATEGDWAQMERQKHPAATAPADSVQAQWGSRVPDRDIVVADGERMRIGDSELYFYITPGHTDATLSTVFEVTDGAQNHTVGFFGGLGTPSTREGKMQLIASAESFKSVVRERNIDVLVANHQTQDQSIPKLEELRLRQPGDPNPYVLGSDAYIRYLSVQQECTRFAMAQQGQGSDQ